MKFWKFIRDSLNNMMNNDSSFNSNEQQQNENDMNNQGSEQSQNNSNQSNSSQNYEQSSQNNGQQNQSDMNNQSNNQQQDNSNQSNSSQNGEQNSQDNEQQNQNDMNNQNSEQQQNSSNQSNSSQNGEQNSQDNGQQNQNDMNNQSSEQQQNNSNQNDNSQNGEQNSQNNEQQNQNDMNNQSSEQQQNSSNQNNNSQNSNSELNNIMQKLINTLSKYANKKSKENNKANQNNRQQQNGGQQNNNNQPSQSSFQNSNSNQNQGNTQSSQNNNKQQNNKTLNRNTYRSKIENLQKLKDTIEKYKIKKQESEKNKKKLSKSHLHNKNTDGIDEKAKEEKYELSEQTNKLLNQLSELPPFENRDRGPGYAIDTDGYTEVPDSVIRTLITKFLNQRFCKNTTNLNIRSNSLEKSKGFYKWEVKDVAIHLKTHQLTKVLNDKYGYKYADGKNENVPLSFYFDMSGSMSSYTNMLAVIAIELLKKDVKVLVGFNERVNVQIEKIDKNMDVKELAQILESAGNYYSYDDKLIKDSRVTYKIVNQNIDNYLIDKKAEKCVVFSDFDPRDEVCRLSQKVKVYWFCFEDYYSSHNLDDFNGFAYKVSNINDIQNGLIKVNENRFETLCYTDEDKKLQKR